MTWYLKYRPKSVADFDLTAVREHLSGMLKSGKSLPHAWLFAGPRGTGKTSMARILAKEINGNDREINQQIEAGTCLDVLEIDAASNRGIDEIRDLRDKIKLAPLAAKFKVYIIDEAHMLTTEAFNALLKTLEEPPAHAVFVLCTTEENKIPETISSRCTLVKFNRPTLAEIVDKLQRVARGEKIKIEKEKLEKIATAAKGSFRDAIKILEQVAASGQSVEEVLGLVESADAAEFITHLRAGDSQAALADIAKLMQQGANLRGFIERCVEELRTELLRSFKDQPLRTSLLGLIEAFSRAYVQIKDAAVPQLPLEVLVIEMTSTNPKFETRKTTSDNQLPPMTTNDRSGEPPANGDEQKLGEVLDRWSDVLKAVRPLNHSVEALLRSTKPVGWDGQTLTLEVFYKFHKDKLETDKCRGIVEEAISRVLGTNGVKLNLRLGTREKKEEISAADIEEDIVAAAAEIFKVDAI